jgi:tetratricopeptide (TPR) repeat protein
MRVRRMLIPVLLAAAAWIAGADAGAIAQVPGTYAAPDAAQPSVPAPRARRPDRAERLEALFDALKRAPSQRAAQAVESRIEAMMLQSGSDTADLLVTRARAMIEVKDYEVSLELLDATIEFAPQFTEAYAQRATVHYLKKDLFNSLADLRVVVAREPRHFGALAGLGVILQDIGERKLALDAFRRAVGLNPHIKGISEMIRRLEMRVEGLEI